MAPRRNRSSAQTITKNELEIQLGGAASTAKAAEATGPSILNLSVPPRISDNYSCPSPKKQPAQPPQKRTIFGDNTHLKPDFMQRIRSIQLKIPAIEGNNSSKWFNHNSKEIAYLFLNSKRTSAKIKFSHA